MALVGPLPTPPQGWGQNGSLQFPPPVVGPGSVLLCAPPPARTGPVSPQTPPPPPGQSFLRVSRIMVLSVPDSLSFKTAAKGYCWGEEHPRAPPAARRAELAFVCPHPRGVPRGDGGGGGGAARWGPRGTARGVHSFGRVPCRGGRRELRVSVRGPWLQPLPRPPPS